MEFKDLVQDTQALKEEREQIAQDLLQSSLFLSYLDEYKIPKELVEKFPMKFSRLFTEIERCQKCTSLASCLSENKGYCHLLSYEDSYLREMISPCRFLKEKQLEEKKIEDLHPELRKYLINDLPQDQRDCAINKIDVKKETNANVEYMKALKEIFTWLKGDKSKGLYLYGAVGVGKTYLAACITNQLAKENRRIVFIHMPSYLVRLKNAFDDEIEYERLIQSCLKCDVLVCDDIGAENVSSWYRDDILLPILNTRMNEKKCTIFTSNLSMDELEAKFRYTSKGEYDELASQRLVDRIRVLSKELEIKGKNRRLQ